MDYTPEQQKAYEEMVLMHYNVDSAYFEEKYGIPCSEKPDIFMPGEEDNNPKQEDGEKKKQKNARPFFD